MASLALAAIDGASATTSPGYRFALPVVITDSGVRLVPHKTKSGALLSRYIKDGGRSAQFPRGVLIEFVFMNQGTKTVLPAIRVTDSKDANPYQKTQKIYKAARLLKPGSRIRMYGNFYFRGAFEIEKLINKKPQGQTVRFLIY